jgi:hypothetical protein
VQGKPVHAGTAAAGEGRALTLVAKPRANTPHLLAGALEAGYANFRNGLRKLASAVNHDDQFTYNDATDEHLDSKWARQVGDRATEMVDALRALDN